LENVPGGSKEALRLEPVAQRLRQAVGLEVDDAGKLA
jgi:hypothetical protein